MKIGVLSDTHECVTAIQWAVTYFNNAHADIFIHLGDIISPIMAAHFAPLTMERVFLYGNNDGEKMWLKEKLKTVYEPPYFITKNGISLYCTHVAPAKWDSVISEYGPDFILFGHTHQVFFEKCDKTVIFNPGEACGLLFGQYQAALIDTELHSIVVKDMNGRAAEYSY